MESPDRVFRISTGDRVFGIEDRQIGTVAGVVGEYFSIKGIDGACFNLSTKDVYMVEHNRVTMVFSSRSVGTHDISRR